MSSTGQQSDAAAALARQGGREWLSLALLESRNELLARLMLLMDAKTAQGEAGGKGDAGGAGREPAAGPVAGTVPAARADALRLAARAGCFQEWWLGRHMQRARGERADANSPRLAGIEPRAEGWLHRAQAEDLDDIRQFLGQTLEQTLELLALASDDDAGLYFFRLALQHDDRISERLGHALAPLLPAPRAPREAIGVPAQRWLLGSGGSEGSGGGERGGFVPHGEHWAHEVVVPEFEIDAQCVSWGQYAEFAEDGGYDRRECWSDSGWAWLQQDGRRAPRDVEQLAGSVLVSRGGQVQRAPAQQAAMRVTRHEAEAWCRWAGRRLPMEPEWELAAHTAARRGFAWGDVLEWVAGSARAYPGAEARVPPGTLDVIGAERRGGGAVSGAAPGAMNGDVNGAVTGTMSRAVIGVSSRAVSGVLSGVLRGCTRATPARWRHPKARRFALPHDDRPCSGFRSCAL